MGSTSTESSSGSAGRYPSGRLLAFAGAGLLVLALAFGPWLVEPLHRDEVLPPEARARLAASRRAFLVLGGVLLLAAALAARSPALGRRGPFRAVLFGLVLGLPVVLIELFAGPFVTHPTTIYRRDAELGWEHVPGAEDYWFGVRVRINEQGWRGPPVARDKAPGERRIVWLGDSVVFGVFVEDDRATLPALVEERLHRAEAPVRSVNLAVSGYSPWQEAIVLERHGLAFDPDLVVLGFVLNDITEKFELTRFGGRREGYHLENLRRTGLPGWVRSLSSVRWLERRRAERRYGRDVQEGAARQERLDVWTAMLHPERPAVQEAWRITLANLERIVELCAARGLPLLVVCFPYVDQLVHPGLGAPQATLGAWARARGVEYLDLLQPLAAWCRATGAEPERLFVDALHPNEAGFAVMGELLLEHLAERGLLR